MRALVRAGLLGMGGLALTAAWPGLAVASTPASVPEISGSSIAVGLGALSAGVLILRSYLSNR